MSANSTKGIYPAPLLNTPRSWQNDKGTLNLSSAQNKYAIERCGVNLALITAVISGVSIFLNKYAVEAVKPALFFTTMKNIGVGFLLLGILLLTKKWKLLKDLKQREVIYLIFIGIVGVSLPFYLYFTGVALIPAINAAIIHKTLVLWVALLAIPLLKEKLTKTQVVAVIFLFAGNFVIGGFKGFQFSMGELLVLLATMLWAIENVLAKKILPKVDPDIVVAARMIIGAVILLTATTLTVPHTVSKVLHFNGAQWWWMLMTVILLLGYVMSWYRALKFAPAITVTAVLVSSTLVTNILSAIFVTHAWTINMGIQAVLILLGLALFWISAREDNINIVEASTISSS